MLRALWLIVLVIAAAPAAAQEYRSTELADAASAYRQELIDSIPATKKQPALIARLRRDADAEYRAKRYVQAIEPWRRGRAYRLPGEFVIVTAQRKPPRRAALV